MAKEPMSFEEHQSRAGKASWAKLTKAQRSAKARHAVKVRWAKAQRKVAGDRIQVTVKAKRKAGNWKSGVKKK